MKDPMRISRISNKIMLVWKEYPELRYFQLMNILFSRMPSGTDLFYLEDNEFEKELDRVIQLESLY